MVKASDYRPVSPGPQSGDTGYREGDFVPDVTALDLRKLYLTENPENKEKYAKMKAKTLLVKLWAFFGCFLTFGILLFLFVHIFSRNSVNRFSKRLFIN